MVLMLARIVYSGGHEADQDEHKWRLPASRLPSIRWPGQSLPTGAALSVVTTLFFMWGFVTVLNGRAGAHLKAVFDLNYARASLIQFAFFTAYFIFSIPAAKLIDWIGYKKTMVWGRNHGTGALSVYSFGECGLLPAFSRCAHGAGRRHYALQVAANPYVAVLGPPETHPAV